MTARLPGARARRALPTLLLTAGMALLAHAGVRHRGARPTPAPPRAPLPGRPRLVTVLGGTVRAGQPLEAREVLLHAGRQIVGRARDADLRLLDPTVSPRHLLLEADRDGRVRAYDLGALNGVIVDGLPIATTELHDGNRLRLGKVQLVFRTDPPVNDVGRSGGELGENFGS